MATMIQHAVLEHNGIWPCEDRDGFRFGQLGVMIWRYEFEAESKRMGFVGKYRWGVEYPTNGKRPDLADDVLVEVKINNHHYKSQWSEYPRTVGVNAWGEPSVAFRITDLRYKPADTSYLNAVREIPESKCEEATVSKKLESKQNELDVSDLIIALSYASNLAVDFGLTDCARDIMDVCKNIQAKSHREKVIEAAIMAVESNNSTSESIYDTLYADGMLVLPGANCNTKD